MIFLKKNDSCIVSKILCALPALTHFDFVCCWDSIIKQIFYAIFCLISKLFTLGKVIFNPASRY